MIATSDLHRQPCWQFFSGAPAAGFRTALAARAMIIPALFVIRLRRFLPVQQRPHCDRRCSFTHGLAGSGR